MKTTFFLTVFVLILNQLSFAVEPMETREWHAKSGHKVQASALKVESGKVHLKKADGKIIKVPLTKLKGEDQEILKKHFGLSDDVELGEGSGVAKAEGLPHPLGEVTGPVDAGNGSSYIIYLPKSLKQGRKAPILFYTHSGGGNKGLINGLTTYADTFGWVLAVSVQSKNADGWEKNVANCKNALEHILANLPVDEKRIHYTGNSGGGAMAFLNSSEVKRAFGVMPNIGYIPQQADVKATVVYGLGGGYDYNRYLTAHAAEKFKRNGFHRMTGQGHGSAPNDHRGDGMFWMHCKYLEKNQRKHEDESKDFELATIKWLEELKDTNSMRAYSNAIFFKEIYKPSGQTSAALEKLISELSQKEDNVLYHQGLLEIDELSGRYLAPDGKGGGSKFSHTNSRASRAAEKLMESHGHIAPLKEVLEAIQKPTVGQ